MEMICKYVYRGREKIGESIDVFEDNLIVKIGGEFIGIPLENVEKIEKDFILVKDFDSDFAKEIGKRWMEEKSKPISLEELERMGL